MLVNADDTIWTCFVNALAEAADTNTSIQDAPAAILWPDKEGFWRNLIPVLRERLPHLITMGPYDHAKRQGPAIYLKCALARSLGDEAWAQGAIPILYLPGVSVAELTPAETCPHELQPIAELVYRGAIWKHPNNRDWTPTSFLMNKDKGLGLHVAEDKQTMLALSRCLAELVDKRMGDLQGKKLDAPFFNHLVMPDLVRDLLRWLDNAAEVRKGWTAEQWLTFCSQVKADYGFDPEKDGDLVGAERLAARRGTCREAWTRYAESPENYPGLPEVIRRATAGQLLYDDPQSLPQYNETEEDHLRGALEATGKLSRSAAIAEIQRLEKAQARRRSWVWSRLGMAQLANALRHLSEGAAIYGQDLAGANADDLAKVYAESGWAGDAAAWQALHSVTSNDDRAAVSAALGAIYAPWLTAAAERLQELVRSVGYPGAKQPALAAISSGECWLFADGLRFDVAQHLVQALVATGIKPDISQRWVPMPSVTATAKFAVSPIADKLTGLPPGAGFMPVIAAGNKALSSEGFQALLKTAGIQFLRASEAGDPKGKAWTEAGELDHLGHDHQASLPRFIPEQIDRLRDRIQELLDAGWRRIRVVTDHGWLLVPTGLPKRNVPVHCVVNESRWSRCAVLTQKAQLDLPTAPWHWHDGVTIALAPGIGAFFDGNFYAHGGLSLQECVAPVIMISSQAPTSIATITDWKWTRLRLRVTVAGASGGEKIDLRTKANDPSSSVADNKASVSVNADGTVTIYAQDDKDGQTSFLVLLDQAGAVIAKQTLEIGA